MVELNINKPGLRVIFTANGTGAYIEINTGEAKKDFF